MSPRNLGRGVPQYRGRASKPLVWAAADLPFPTPYEAALAQEPHLPGWLSVASPFPG